MNIQKQLLQFRITMAEKALTYWEEMIKQYRVIATNARVAAQITGLSKPLRVIQEAQKSKQQIENELENLKKELMT